MAGTRQVEQSQPVHCSCPLRRKSGGGPICQGSTHCTAIPIPLPLLRQRRLSKLRQSRPHRRKTRAREVDCTLHRCFQDQAEGGLPIAASASAASLAFLFAIRQSALETRQTARAELREWRTRPVRAAKPWRPWLNLLPKGKGAGRATTQGQRRARLRQSCPPYSTQRLS